ncbi:hypothetical protein PCASD_14953 [Puccinia coronata f. sp. avenae]|uniref:Uncharacterized protein n=1 Tax=Puccinia coronata f. sp. avenae TaxID=200324 RepID=A0A2N5U7A4_9BASI|nr:hypothetical protein PCASD_24106 [Puccinia coronata f. sp. avenae]PLW33631.1 hypothetical protein PCASD_14953 [Puccinia coronata f. sp. avenae]
MLMMTAGEMMVGRPEEREADQMKQNKKKAQPEGSPPPRAYPIDIEESTGSIPCWKEFAATSEPLAASYPCASIHPLKKTRLDLVGGQGSQWRSNRQWARRHHQQHGSVCCPRRRDPTKDIQNPIQEEAHPAQPRCEAMGTMSEESVSAIHGIQEKAAAAMKKKKKKKKTRRRRRRVMIQRPPPPRRQATNRRKCSSTLCRRSGSMTRTPASEPMPTHTTLSQYYHSLSRGTCVLTPRQRPAFCKVRFIPLQEHAPIRDTRLGTNPLPLFLPPLSCHFQSPQQQQHPGPCICFPNSPGWPALLTTIPTTNPPRAHRPDKFFGPTTRPSSGPRSQTDAILADERFDMLGGQLAFRDFQVFLDINEVRGVVVCLFRSSGHRTQTLPASSPSNRYTRIAIDARLSEPMSNDLVSFLQGATAPAPQ